MSLDIQGLKEDGIPADLLPQTRAWWSRQMEQLAKAHGDRWPDHREWLADYLNADIRERLKARGL